MPDLRCCACGETFASRDAAGQHLVTNPPSHFFEEVADAAPEDQAEYITEKR
jgi:hypothetical protein